MKVGLVLLLGILLSTLMVADEALSLRDVEGAVHTPLATRKTTVLIFITTDCPISNSFAPEINRIVESYTAKDMMFYLVHVDPDLKVDEAKKHATEYGFHCPVLLDPRHALVRRVGATVTPEAAVFSAEGKRLYRGRIDDRFVDFGKKRAEPTRRDLREVLDEILSGKAVSTVTTTAIGCFISPK